MTRLVVHVTGQEEHARLAGEPLAEGHRVADAQPREADRRRIGPDPVDDVGVAFHEGICELQVAEHERVVEDPPRVIVRRHHVEDAPAKRKRMATVETEAAPPHGGARDGKARVIHAEAEVTILGPDRITIRLFRKRATNAKAEATKADAK